MGNMRTEGGLYLPKVTLLLGVEWKPNSGHVTPGPVLFPQRPSVATAPRCLGALGAGGAICPRERHSWNLPPLGPGKGLCSRSLGSS